MKSLGTEFKVGLFTIVGLIATGYLFLVLSPGAFERRTFKSYYTILHDASGIMPQTQVKTNGVTVGTVESVRLDVSSTHVSFRVDADVKIPQGSTLEIRTVGLLGDKFIEIMRVDDISSGYVAENGLIPRSEDANDLASLMGIAGEIARDVKKITQSLAGVFGDDAGEDRIHAIVDNVEGVTAHARLLLEENRRDVREVVSNLRATTETLKALMNSDNKERFDRILASVDTSMEDVQHATRNINLIAQRVEKGEGTLGKLINDEAAIDELQAVLGEIREVIAPAGKLKIDVDMHSYYRTNESSQTHFNLYVRTRPDRFYLLGITDRQDHVRETTSETLDPTPEFDEANQPTRQRDTVREKDRLVFNLQMGKRFGFAQFRIGLFESSGGVGSDFFFFKDRLRLTLEAFDWQRKFYEERRTAHLRAYARILFFDHIYMMLGIDDPTRLDSETGKVIAEKDYFIGAGITFNDDDLKAMFGAAAIAL